VRCGTARCRSASLGQFRSAALPTKGSSKSTAQRQQCQSRCSPLMFDRGLICFHSCADARRDARQAAACAARRPARGASLDSFGLRRTAPRRSSSGALGKPWTLKPVAAGSGRRQTSNSSSCSDSGSSTSPPLPTCPPAPTPPKRAAMLPAPAPLMRETEPSGAVVIGSHVRPVEELKTAMLRVRNGGGAGVTCSGVTASSSEARRGEASNLLASNPGRLPSARATSCASTGGAGSPRTACSASRPTSRSCSGTAPT
jgi:hypothetical protein